jgi:uncharacterized phage protein (TIGR01671 family)
VREIKFRAWYGNRWEIALVIGEDQKLRYVNMAAGLSNFTQYTGLEDKNSEEIYEGDIVKPEIKSGGKWVEEGKAEIQFVNCGFSCVSNGGNLPL